MKPVTIDNLDIKDHIRWAQDRAILDTKIVRESQSIAPYPDITGTSAIFPSQLEELFDWEKGMHPWASFSPPGNLNIFSKRFFSHRLFPHIQWEDQKEEEEKEQQEQEENGDSLQKRSKSLMQQVIAVEKLSHQPRSLFEKDKSSILSLLESIQSIDDMLEQICNRKLQYQKG